MRRREPQGDIYDNVHVLLTPTQATYKVHNDLGEVIDKREVQYFHIKPTEFGTVRWAPWEEIEAEYQLVMEGSYPDEEWVAESIVSITETEDGDARMVMRSNIEPTWDEILRARTNAELHRLPDPTIRPDLRMRAAEQQQKINDTLARVDELLRKHEEKTP